jgi:hypothetical protein
MAIFYEKNGYFLKILSGHPQINKHWISAITCKLSSQNEEVVIKLFNYLKSLVFRKLLYNITNLSSFF